jgi:hypothetical protein
MPRPTVDESKKRGETVQVCLSKPEREALDAAKGKQSRSDWIREKLLQFLRPLVKR